MPQAEPTQSDVTILFNHSKREVNSPASGFKKLHRKLRNTFKININKDEITPQTLRDATVVVFGCPREKFSVKEFDALKSYINSGGSVLLMVGEGGETKWGTNVNYFLEEFGIWVNSDAVVRSSYLKYMHPKEVLISSGIVNRELNRAAGKRIPGGSLLSGGAPRDKSAILSNSIEFVFPYGATLNVVKPATPVLSTGFTSFPINRPVCAFYKHAKGGRIAVMGSHHIFEDNWLDKEENAKLQEVIFKWLIPATSFELNPIDAEDPEVSDYHCVPDIEQLADHWKGCLQETEEVPRDFLSLYDDSLFKFDTNLIPEAIDLYRTLGVKHDPLSLIPPQFESPLPPLRGAVFGAMQAEMGAPALELFDLDDHFASNRVRLANLANSCSSQAEADLDYFIREAGSVLGIQAPTTTTTTTQNNTTQKQQQQPPTAKQVLEVILKQIVRCKKVTFQMDE